MHHDSCKKHSIWIPAQRICLKGCRILNTVNHHKGPMHCFDSRSSNPIVFNRDLCHVKLGPPKSFNIMYVANTSADIHTLMNSAWQDPGPDSMWAAKHVCASQRCWQCVEIITPAATSGGTDSDTARYVSTSMHTLKLTLWLHLGDILVAGWL